MTSLYLCYQSVQEPLTLTQVVAYLEGLALAGHRMILLTFEPRPLSETETKTWRERLAAKGVTWHWLRYHKRPTVPATAWDVLMGICKGWQLILRHRVRLVHARCHVPGVMALVLKHLTGVRFLFDVRGFMAEEYVDGGVWRAGGLLYRLTKWVERRLVRAADGIVVLTHAAQRLFLDWYRAEVGSKPFEVIPCCVDFRQLPPEPDHALQSDVPRTIAYAGKLGGWYPVGAMLGFLRAMTALAPDASLQVWTQSDAHELHNEVRGLGLASRVKVGRVAPDGVAAALASADAGLCLYVRNLSKSCCSPTKLGEYLAAGLPVVCSAGIGDTDALLAGEGGPNGPPVGVSVKGLSETAYREAAFALLPLLRDPGVRRRCRTAAERHLHLESVGWSAYRRLYSNLLARAQNVGPATTPSTRPANR